MNLLGVLLVFAGGGAGAVARYGVHLASVRAFGPAFPVGTLSVNVIGSFLMGLAVAWLMGRTGTIIEELRLFLAVGLLGGFTTFSTFSLDAVRLWQAGEGGMAALYIGLSVVLSITGLVAGLAAYRTLAGAA